jgi:glycerol uptake facilitator protein
LVAEAIGTLLLVLFGAGSLVAAILVGKGHVTYAGVGIIAFSFAIAVAAAIYMFGPVSGAHINPAVTIALAAVRRFPLPEVIPYIFAQLVGGMCGGLLINAIFGSAARTASYSGGTVVQAGYSSLQAVIAEGLGTALLLLAVMAMAVDTRAPAGWAGLIIGLVVACEIMVIGPISDGSVNPARTFGPYAATAILGGTTPWNEYWIYVAGPVVGAIVAAFIYVFVAHPQPLREAGQEPTREPAS